MLHVPQSKGVEAGVVNREARSGKGAHISHDRDGVGGSEEEGGRSGGSGLDGKPAVSRDEPRGARGGEKEQVVEVLWRLPLEAEAGDTGGPAQREGR